MNSDPENFDALRRLLTLKRYEQPPPGYFNTFSSQVLARIRAGEQGESVPVMGSLLGLATWWQRLCAALEAKPGFAGAFGAAVCAVVISGIVYSENAPMPVAQALMPAESGTLFATASAAIAGDSLDQSASFTSSTNPVSPAASSLFEQLPLFQSQPASLVLSGGN